MKLVFLSHEYHCMGGAQKCLLNLLKGLKQNHPEWEIYMIFPGRGDFVDACSCYLDGYKIFRMKWWLVGENERITIRMRLSYIRKLVKTGLKLAWYINRIKPDYAVTNTLAIPYLAFTCKLLNIKHYWFIHEAPAATWTNLEFILKPKMIFKLVDRLSSKILVTSKYVKQYYQCDIMPSKLFVITQAVELESVSGVDLNRDSHKRYTLLMVGAFDSNKGQLDLLHAIKVILDEGRDVFCYLVGPDFGFSAVCEDYIKKNMLTDNVKIVPFVKQIYPYYYEADALLVCSTFETFSRVAVEAQMCGLPVILSNVGANPERIKDGVDGLLYQKGDVIDLVKKIEILRDVSTRKRFSANINPAMVMKKYSLDNFASDFSALLNT